MPKAKTPKVKKVPASKSEERRIDVMKKEEAKVPEEKKEEIGTPPKGIGNAPVLYKLSIIFNGATHTIETSDIVDAFLTFKPPKMTSRVHVHTELNGVVNRRSFFAPQARRLFNNANMAQIIAKKIYTALK